MMRRKLTEEGFEEILDLMHVQQKANLPCTELAQAAYSLMQDPCMPGELHELSAQQTLSLHVIQLVKLKV